MTKQASFDHSFQTIVEEFELEPQTKFPFCNTSVQNFQSPKPLPISSATMEATIPKADVLSAAGYVHARCMSILHFILSNTFVLQPVG